MSHAVINLPIAAWFWYVVACYRVWCQYCFMIWIYLHVRCAKLYEECFIQCISTDEYERCFPLNEHNDCTYFNSPVDIVGEFQCAGADSVVCAYKTARINWTRPEMRAEVWFFAVGVNFAVSLNKVHTKWPNYQLFGGHGAHSIAIWYWLMVVIYSLYVQDSYHFSQRHASMMPAQQLVPT